MKDITTAIQNSMGGTLQCRDVSNQSWVIRDRTSNCLRRLIGNPAILNEVLNNVNVVSKKITNHALFRSTVGVTNFVI